MIVAAFIPIRPCEQPVRRHTALMLLLLTLWCALCPLGLPASRATGSAFNPANEVVTTTPRRQQAPVVRIVRRVPAAPVRAAIQAPASIASVPALPRLLGPVRLAPRLTDTTHTPFLPRAPPLAA
jgi:hypothetical protein